jgi:hypothetical protein
LLIGFSVSPVSDRASFTNSTAMLREFRPRGSEGLSCVAGKPIHRWDNHHVTVAHVIQCSLKLGTLGVLARSFIDERFVDVQVCQRFNLPCLILIDARNSYVADPFTALLRCYHHRPASTCQTRDATYPDICQVNGGWTLD